MSESFTWGDTLLVMGAAAAGVAARLSHLFAKRQDEAAATGTKSRGITLSETVVALIAAPALGFIAGAFGRWQGWSVDINMGLAGFAGLAGPAALLVLWDRIVEPLIALLRGKTG